MPNEIEVVEEPTVTVAFNGPQGSGKTLAMRVCYQALKAAGVDVVVDDENGFIHTLTLTGVVGALVKEELK
jgi:thymidylate kinase